MIFFFFIFFPEFFESCAGLKIFFLDYFVLEHVEDLAGFSARFFILQANEIAHFLGRFLNHRSRIAVFASALRGGAVSIPEIRRVCKCLHCLMIIIPPGVFDKNIKFDN